MARRGVVLAAVWLVSRAVLVWLLLGPQSWVGGDVTYFEASLAVVDDVGLARTLVEYPLPAVAVVAAPWLLALLTGLPYAVLLLASAALTDLAWTVLLARSSREWLPALVWVAGVPLLGTTAYARFDLLPGVLAGAAVLFAATRPRTAGMLVAAATAVKLWPAVLVPPVLAVARPRRDAVAAVVVTGGLLTALTLALAGWGRLWSPLTYQAERGLQIESVAATPAMLAWWLVPGRWSVAYAPSKAFEVAGPGVDLLLAVTTLASVLYVAGLALAGLRLWQVRDAVRPPTVVWWGLLAVTGFVVTGKVLSPQYLLWLLPVAAAGLVVADSGPLRRWTASLLLAAALTQVVFPTTYGAVTTGVGGPVWLPVVALALRNVLMVQLLVVAGTQLWRALEADRQRGSALTRQAPGPEARGVRTRR